MALRNPSTSSRLSILKDKAALWNRVVGIMIARRKEGETKFWTNTSRPVRLYQQPLFISFLCQQALSFLFFRNLDKATTGRLSFSCRFSLFKAVHFDFFGSGSSRQRVLGWFGCAETLRWALYWHGLDGKKRNVRTYRIVLLCSLICRAVPSLSHIA